MENQTTENMKSPSIIQQIIDGIVLILSFFFVCGIVYLALYYGNYKNQFGDEETKLQLYQKQSEVLQKHIATNDSILFHLINENKTLRSRYDSIVNSSKNDSPKFLPLFSK